MFLQVVAMVGLGPIVFSQQVSIPFNADLWQLSGKYEVESYKGRKSPKVNNGRAILPDLQMKNGIIEYEILHTPVTESAGVRFRMQNDENYKEYYRRSHRSVNPDAMRYTPAFNTIPLPRYHENKTSSTYTDRHV